MDCPLCDEPVRDLDVQTLHTEEGARNAHRICMLREVIGGIGHLIAHDYWCLQKHDPDGGLTRYQSAQLTEAYVRAVGIVEASRVSSVG